MIAITKQSFLIQIKSINYGILSFIGLTPSCVPVLSERESKVIKIWLIKRVEQIKQLLAKMSIITIFWKYNGGNSNVILCPMKIFAQKRSLITDVTLVQIDDSDFRDVI